MKAPKPCEHNAQKRCVECANKAHAERRREKRAADAKVREHDNAVARAWRDANRHRNTENRRRWRQKNAVRDRDQRYKRKGYVFSPGQTIESMLAEQNNRCAICNLAFARTPHVDHDHTIAGAPNVRGLLCGACNKALGLFRDNEDLLYRAADYLLKNSMKSEAA